MSAVSFPIPRLNTYSDYLDCHADTRGDTAALWYQGQTLSYRVLSDLVHRMCGSLAAMGLQPGDRVAVLCTPRPEFLITLLAAFRLGLVWVGLNPKYTYRELAHVVRDSRPSALLSMVEVDGRRFDADVQKLASEFDVATVASIGDETRDSRLPSLPNPVAYTPHASRPQDPATIVYTSGSSGTPKGAVLSHYGLVYAAWTEASVNNVPYPRVPCNLPINHVACLADLAGTTLVSGGMLALLESFDPAEMLDLVERLRLTHLMSVPTVLQMIAMQADFERRDLSSLRLVAWGGAPLPMHAIRNYRRLGTRLLTVYGMTETIASITFTDPDASDEILACTVGRPDPGMQVRVADGNNQSLATGGTGEIQVRHEGLFLEYFGRAQATQDAYTSDGWFRTGDIGILRSDGNLQLVGRCSDMFKSGGHNVYPREIELCLESRPDVALVAVVGQADETFGEVGVAYVQPIPGCQVDQAQLRDFCRQHLANYKIPKRFVVVDALPLLPVGKVDKQELRKRADRDDD